MPDNEDTLIPELTDDAFDLAFEAAAEVTLPSELPAAPEKPEEAPPEKSEAPPEKKEEPPAPSSPEKKEAPPAPTPPASTTPPAPDPVAEAAAKKAADDAAEATRVAAEAATAREVLTEEEKTALASVQADFPETAKLIEAVQRTTIAKMENLYEAKLKELETRFAQQMAPALQTAQVVASNAFDAALLKEHADAFTIIPAVEAWIATKPKFLQASYNAAFDSTDVSDAIQLISLFKQETGSAQPENPDKSVDEEKEKRLKAQEGVTRRTSMGRTAAVDPDDFDGAFDKFATTA